MSIFWENTIEALDFECLWPELVVWEAFVCQGSDQTAGPKLLSQFIPNASMQLVHFMEVGGWYTLISYAQSIQVYSYIILTLANYMFVYMHRYHLTCSIYIYTRMLRPMILSMSYINMSCLFHPALHVTRSSLACSKRKFSWP